MLKAFFNKILYTFLTPQFLWKHVIKDYDPSHSLDISNFQKILFKFFWFWPTLYRVRTWVNAGPDDGHGYKKFINMDGKANVLMKEVVYFSSNKNNKILDLGCNVGRCLNYLKDRGYSDLYGVDVSIPAVNVMRDIFPNLYNVAHVETKTFQEFLLNSKDKYFDIIYTLGATVELVPPSFPLIKELTRVANKYVIFMISENGHWYSRFWEYEFSTHSFTLIKKYFYSQDKNMKGDMVLFVFKREDL